MNQPAKAQEPSMEEILASIRRIIADEDTAKPAAPPKPVAVAPPAQKPAPAAAPAPAPAANNQSDIDAMLADLDAAPRAPPPKPVAAAPPPPKVEPPVADVLDLTEAMAAPGPAAAFRTIDAASDVIFTDRAPDAPMEPAARPVEEPRRPAAVSYEPERGGLISNSTVSAVDSAFNALAHTVLGNNARTLEDLVKEMLRPMLKSWLDDNLPSLVERIVRAEIERVSRGRS
jgi:cell pole-organizing protein PopZ